MVRFHEFRRSLASRRPSPIVIATFSFAVTAAALAMLAAPGGGL